MEWTIWNEDNRAEGRRSSPLSHTFPPILSCVLDRQPNGPRRCEVGGTDDYVLLPNNSHRCAIL
jgi:hypothetical protein